MRAVAAFFLLPALIWAKALPVSLHDLHPSQFSVGYRALAVKVEEVRAVENPPHRLDAFLKKNEFPVVRGPRGVLYLIDHHHLGLALVQRGVKSGYHNVDADWSSLEDAEFWKKMEAEKKVYLRDATGRLRTPAELPATLSQLADDPYRSLAYFVRERGGFKKTKVPFAEFLWADFFRPRIPVGSSDAAFEVAISSAMSWARRPEASHLPGYIP